MKQSSSIRKVFAGEFQADEPDLSKLSRNGLRGVWGVEGDLGDCKEEKRAGNGRADREK